MKTVRELSRDELSELKEAYLMQHLDEAGESPSYGELFESHDISDEIIFEHYDGISFEDEDFWCNV